MAKLVSPMLSLRAKGSVSGVTFREYRGLPVATRRPMPRKVRSALVPERRSVMGWLSRKWQTLTGPERLLWTAYGQNNPQPDGMGGTFQLDGMQAFIMLNACAMSMLAGTGFKSAPPLTEPGSTVGTLTAITGIGIAGDIDCTVTLLSNGVAADCIRYEIAGPFSSQARGPASGKFKVGAEAAGNVLTKTISGLAAGWTYWIRASYIDQYGQKTNGVLDQATAKA